MGERYHQNLAIVVKLYQPYTQLTRNVRLSHLWLFRHSGGASWLFLLLCFINTLTYLLTDQFLVDNLSTAVPYSRRVVSAFGGLEHSIFTSSSSKPPKPHIWVHIMESLWRTHIRITPQCIELRWWNVENWPCYKYLGAQIVNCLSVRSAAGG